jgi:hypothetical protein
MAYAFGVVKSVKSRILKYENATKNSNGTDCLRDLFEKQSNPAIKGVNPIKAYSEIVILTSFVGGKTSLRIL